MDLELTDKVALVTGGSEGIGESIAVGLASEGCRVAICARSEDKLDDVADQISERDGEVLATMADVTDPSDIERLVEETVDRFGTVHILVNNAGIRGGQVPFDELSPEDWHEVFDVNLVGSVRVTKRVLPYMQDQEWGRIINIASEAGVKPDPFMPHYNASKAALLNLTKSLSKAYGDDGILVNAVSPTTTRTPFVETMLEEIADERGIDVEQAREKFREENRPNIVLGRLAAPEEVAAAVTFLASEEASFITGENYRIDGGSVPTM